MGSDDPFSAAEAPLQSALGEDYAAKVDHLRHISCISGNDVCAGVCTRDKSCSIGDHA